MAPGEYASLSNVLMDTAIVAYSVAALGYAVEQLTTRVVPAAARAPERVLVGAAGAERAVADGGEAVPDEPAPSRWSARSAVIGRLAVAVTVVGWLAHLGEIVTRGLAADRLPWGNMYEFTSTMCFAAVSGYLCLLLRHRVRFLGLYVLGLVVLGLGIDGAVLYKSAGPLVPALHSYWIAIHVTAATLALGLFTLATVASALYLLAERRERTTGLLARLPAPAVLDSLAYRVIAVAFPIWTFGIVAGAIWAEAAWGRYWGWDPKETWSFIVWVIYAGYLHARSTAGWRGRKAASIALVAFAAILVNYFVVNVWIVGFHSYAGVNS